MISHVFIGADDLDRAMGFYGPVMEALGYPLKSIPPAAGQSGPRRAERGRF